MGGRDEETRNVIAASILFVVSRGAVPAASMAKEQRASA